MRCSSIVASFIPPIAKVGVMESLDISSVHTGWLLKVIYFDLFDDIELGSKDHRVHCFPKERVFNGEELRREERT